jgi:hypothetical protein
VRVRRLVTAIADSQRFGILTTPKSLCCARQGRLDFVAVTMQYAMGPSGALTSGSSTGASTLFQRAWVISRLPNTTSVIRNFRVTQGMCITEGATRICRCSTLISRKPSCSSRAVNS